MTQESFTYKYDVALVRVGVTQRKVEDRLRADVPDDRVGDPDEAAVLRLLEDSTDQPFLSTDKGDPSFRSNAGKSTE